MQNITNTYTNSPQKGLVTDLDDLLVDKDVWTHARNSVLNSHDGKIQILQNEPSNLFCLDFPYTPIGFIKLKDSRLVVFTTDNVDSEIGIFDSRNCTYIKLVNDKCLNFNKSNLIKGRAKDNFDCTQSVYWTDGRRNPRRKLNIDNIPYQFTLQDDSCKTKVFTTKLDCNALLVSPRLTVPTITVSEAEAGNLENGTYQFAMAYTLNEERITNFYSLTNPVSLFSHENFGKSLVVNLNNLDTEFKQYELIVIYTQKNTTTAKTLGFFSTSFNNHQITSVTKAEYITLPLEDIVTTRPYYFASDDVASNDNFLLWSGVTTRPEINYQQQAMNIQPKWVMWQEPKDYYAKGGQKVGYLRGEVYAFGIDWLYDTGDYSSIFSIGGRKIEGDEKNNASGKDVFEKSDSSYIPKVFEVYDTSKGKKRINNIPNVIAEGKMSYWESSEQYPNNTIQWGEDACQPIRHHKFPEEAVAPRFESGGEHINILGVKFENIEHPKDENGDYLTTIVGYRIWRSSRDGNRSIVAKGVFTNVRSYTEKINQAGNDQEVLFANYPYNDLRADPFLSSKQTFFKSSEQGYTALKDYKKDSFNFYSPDTLFSNPSLGGEIIFDTEESGDVFGYYEDVFNHPRAKLLKNSVFWLAVLTGAIDGVVSVWGKKCVTTIKNDTRISTVVEGTEGGKPLAYEETTKGIPGLLETHVQECEGIVNGLSGRSLLNLPIIEAAAKTALRVLQLAAKVGTGVYFAFNTANAFLNTVEAYLPFQKYAVQYNSHGLLSESKAIEKDNRRRELSYYQYLYDGINSIQGKKFNNYKREKSVYIKAGDIIKEPSVKDTTRKTIGEDSSCDGLGKSIKTKASAYYGFIKKRITNQYGQIDSFQYVDTGSQFSVTLGEDKFYKSDPIFGGDTYIVRQSIKRTQHFFRQNIANSNYPDGTEYDYSLYRNVAFPRYWLNSEHYEISELLTVGKIPNKLPTNKYNLDCFKKESGIRSINLKGVEGKFYIYNSGVLEFFVESDKNIEYRDYTTEQQNFYNDKFTNLSELFKSDKIDIKEQFIYDDSYSKQLKEVFGQQQRIDYDPAIDEKCFSYHKNRVIYSLPSSKDERGDNWLIYLANNFYDFSASEFGSLTSMQPIDNQQIMFLFDKSAPYVTVGRDELQTEAGVKITIGDGGLFAREPRPLLYTDYYYGNSQSKWAFVNTQFGTFYPSQRQGRIFRVQGEMDEITRNGMHWWFKNYMPSNLLKDFPNFRDSDNAVNGVGLVSVFDNTDEKYYVSKKDYALKSQFVGAVLYDETKNEFSVGGSKIQLTDTDYFEDASWTISYDPKSKVMISWHDWHPEWMIQGETHFMSVKGTGIWKHNERHDSYCNFYGVDYPWEVEYLINNGQNVEVLRSIEYVLEAGKYFNKGRDFHHILDDNFDSLVVHNSEQSSGYLSLVLSPKGKISQILEYPKLTVDGWVVRYDKEENKYRINEFFDLCKDRGEFSKNNYPLWTSAANGYIKTVTDAAINTSKSIFQRKKFRHLQHKIFLSKSVSKDRKFLFKLANAKQTESPR